jgi:N-acetylneuraminate lyase
MLVTFPDARIFNGYDELLLPATSVGAVSAIGSTYNVFGPIAKGILAMALKEELNTARKLQNLLNEAISEIIPLGLYPSLKAIMADQTGAAGLCKAPFTRQATPEIGGKAVAIGRRINKSAAALLAAAKN